MRQIYSLFFLIILFTIVGCSSDNDGPIDETPTEVSPVIFDINAVPYPKLSDYNFFKGNLANLDPVYGVLPYEPISSLFTDYALKSRFVWMPDGVSANYVADDKIFNFPSSTVLIKNFYYNNVAPNNSKKILETRLMIKKGSEWIFANYKWNDTQDEAVLDMEGSFVPVEWSQNGETKNVLYRIPSKSECLTCHKQIEAAIPIGPKPQNLNFNINYSDGNKNQIEKWEEFGYLNIGSPGNIVSMVNYTDNSKSLDQRIRSYLDINCAHCHNETGHCNYLPIKLAYSETADPLNLGVCIVPNINISGFVGEEVTHIVVPNNPGKSAMYHRIKSDLENIRMPMIGRSLVHDEAVTLTTQWINSLEGECN
ncbi:hypothetical protein [Moheibacter sediminis]|uniref:Uncharacterized protein n=1 Tax=Moheibacter sediminis TaxID=1434700 RepID=A0A1W1ZX29_9FLAO|nr:hypothetical protein [Moheibacter sediminis]SMC52628.1 conserved hypothetical protein, HNE_0200 family [Moheibacter sediminis]